MPLPSQVYLLRDCALTWLSRSCASPVSRSCAHTRLSPGHVPLGSVLRDSNLQELCTSTLLYPGHRPLGLQITPPPPTSGSRAPLRLFRDYIPRSIPVTCATPASRSYTPTLLQGSRASLALGHTPSPLTPPYTHMHMCARAHFPRFQGHKLAWPPISGSHASSPTTPVKCFRAQGQVPLHTPSLAHRLHISVAQLWSKASPLLTPACWYVHPGCGVTWRKKAYLSPCS